MNATEPFHLTGSRDDVTGQVFFPARALAADGSLRPLTPVALPRTGSLHSFAVVGEVTYGLVDLADGVRLQTELAPGVPEIGKTYRLTGDDNGWRFERA